MKTVGGFLKSKRIEAGLSTLDVERRCGVTHSYVSQIERNKKTPSLDILARLLSALQADWIEFLTATGYVKKKQGETPYRVEEASTRTLHEKTDKYPARRKPPS